MVEKFPLLIDAYENKDFVLISDVLDYEIKPVLEMDTSGTLNLKRRNR